MKFHIVAILLAAIGVAVGAEEKTLDLPAGCRVVIDVKTTDVRVTAGADGAIRLVADSLDGVTYQLEGTVMTVAVPQGPGVPIKLVVEVPAKTGARVLGAKSNLQVDGLGASLLVQTDLGNIEVFDIDGHVDAHSDNGNIILEDISGDVRADTHLGEIRIRRVGGDIDARTVASAVSVVDSTPRSLEMHSVAAAVTYSGPVPPDAVFRMSTHKGLASLHLTGDADVELEIRVVRSRLTVEAPGAVVRYKSARHSIVRLGDGLGRIHVSSREGSVEIRTLAP